ncbi:MAG: hypothetical protein ACLU9S_14650 [Oscillospiraceae bacterium]
MMQYEAFATLALRFADCRAGDLEQWGVSGPAAPGQRGLMRMLWAMLDKPMSARELAQQLDMHLGVVCRDLANLFNSKLLITESVKGRNRYRTNRESLVTLARHLMEMEKFKPPEAGGAEA